MKQQRYLVVILIVLFTFLLFVNLSEGRSSARGVVEEYWKKMIKNEPLPEPIKEPLSNPFRTAQERFIQDFDTRAVVLIYRNPNE